MDPQENLSMLRVVATEYCFLRENVTFGKCLVDLLSVLNEFNQLSISKYCTLPAKSTGYFVLHDLVENENVFYDRYWADTTVIGWAQCRPPEVPLEDQSQKLPKG